MDNEYLKKLNILYVEDNLEIQSTTKSVMERIFNNVFVASNGVEALDIFRNSYNKEIEIHGIISDINMPHMDGITLLRNIREENRSIPFIFVTAYSELEYLHQAIDLNVKDYILKPFDIKELILKMGTSCLFVHRHHIIEKQKIELERYLRAIDDIAIISKTDTKGRITFVNHVFCETSGYEKSELLGKPHNMIRHPEMSSAAFKNLWETIQSGNTWQGKVKNLSKDKSTYYVNATILPLYDDMNENIVEYMGIRFLTTEDEVEKREFKRKVMKNIQKSKQADIQSQQKIQCLEDELEKFGYVNIVQNALERERKKSKELIPKISYYEEYIKNIDSKKEKVIKHNNESIKKATRMASNLKGANKEMQAKISLLESSIKAKKEQLAKLSKKDREQKRIIANLNDVVEHREDQLNRFV